MDTLEYIKNKFSLDYKQPSPIEIPNSGRKTLALMLAELGFNTGVEVGTWRGQFAEILLKANPALQLYCVDPWKTYGGYTDFKSQDSLDWSYQRARKRLAPYNCSLMRMPSLEGMDHFAEGSVDFVYIDGNHDFPNVVQDIHGWLPKVRVGGILAGHDYRRCINQHNMHVYEAVNGYTASYHIEPWFVLGRKDRIEGELREGHRSFMWVKC